MKRENRIPEIIGVVAALICLQIFGAGQFVLPSMIAMVAVLFVGRKRFDKGVDESCH